MLEVGMCPRLPGPSRAAPAATGSPEGRRSRWAPSWGFLPWIRDRMGGGGGQGAGGRLF